MAKDNVLLPYPRKRVLRFICKMLFRSLLNIFFRVDVFGLENFPRKGPLLIVGNHTGAMEVVVLNAYAPRQIEMLSAADMPTEKITEVINSIYGSIPIKRGSYDRSALQTALDVLNQGGMVGLFPEGGVWDVGKQRALPGISWLSYRSGAPILPVGFNDTAGALGAGLKFRRPGLKMFVGKILAPAAIPPGTAKKTYFQRHAAQVMEEVYQLVPADDAPPQLDMTDESYDLEITIMDAEGNQIEFPAGLDPGTRFEMGRFFMLPHLLDIFLLNLELPVQPLKQLHSDPPQHQVIEALSSIITYLKEENPYLLTYRFGAASGFAMQEGLEKLLGILDWSAASGYRTILRVSRQYYSILEEKVINQRDQESAQPWM